MRAIGDKPAAANRLADAHAREHVEVATMIQPYGWIYPAPPWLLRLGAGTLSMLPVVAAAASQAGWQHLDYCAFDSDACLLDAAAAALISSGDHVADASAATSGPLRL